MNTTVKNSLFLSFILSFVAFPFMSIVLIFYYIFSGITKNSLLFNSVSLTMYGNTGFSFSVNPNFFILMAIVFAVTFIISLTFQKVLKNK